MDRSLCNCLKRQSPDHSLPPTLGSWLASSLGFPKKVPAQPIHMAQLPRWSGPPGMLMKMQIPGPRGRPSESYFPGERPFYLQMCIIRLTGNSSHQENMVNTTADRENLQPLQQGGVSWGPLKAQGQVKSESWSSWTLCRDQWAGPRLHADQDSRALALVSLVPSFHSWKMWDMGQPSGKMLSVMCVSLIDWKWLSESQYWEFWGWDWAKQERLP